MTKKLSVLVIGAHPDDCDIKAGGAAALYAAGGHRVKFVSMTNGDAGHHEVGGAPLARRRRQEAAGAARVLGISYDVLDNHDGELVPTLANRRETIRLIRRFQPDLIMTHRTNDYHPDHRYTSQLVQDAAFMVTVPNVVSDAPALETNPVILYLSDHFQKPAPFRPDVVVDIGPVIEQKIAALHEHTSQMYEWLPFNGRYADEVPSGEEERKRWLSGRMKRRFAADERTLARAVELYGAEWAEGIRWVESFEACEYGSPLTDDNLHRMFPFFGQAAVDS